MSALPATKDSRGGEVLVPLERVVAFVRHFTHDVRNTLNAMDLQTAFAVELASDPEITAELKKIRAMISSSSRTLQGISNYFWVGEPNLVEYSARIFVEDLRDRMSRLLPEHSSDMEWSNELANETVALDLEMISRASGELLKNAFHFSEPGEHVAVRASAPDGQFLLEIREPRKAVVSPPATWGREPLVSSRRGGFGVSLYHAREILKAHRGEITIRHDPAAALLVTQLALPLAAAGE